MIRHHWNNATTTLTGNRWQVGSVVRVGWLSLRVLGSRSEKDGLPDIYTLESLDGVRKYEFVPYNGLVRVA